MSVFNVLKIGRKLHPNTLFIIDNYDKYYVYDQDCYVIYKALGFEICGEKSIFIRNKIEFLPYLVKNLSEKRIDYKVLCKRHSYDIDDEACFLDNQYSKFLKNGKLSYQRNKKIKQIYRRLNYVLKRNPEKAINLIRQIERIIYV